MPVSLWLIIKIKETIVTIPLLSHSSWKCPHYFLNFREVFNYYFRRVYCNRIRCTTSCWDLPRDKEPNFHQPACKLIHSLSLLVSEFDVYRHNNLCCSKFKTFEKEIVLWTTTECASRDMDLPVLLLFVESLWSAFFTQFIHFSVFVGFVC